MATHSSILAWEIPMDRGAWWATVHKVRHNWSNLACTHSFTTFSQQFLLKLQMPVTSEDRPQLWVMQKIVEFKPWTWAELKYIQILLNPNKPASSY